MIFIAEEKRSQGGLFAFIDLLFLLVAFMVLVLFFIKNIKSEAEVRLESAQTKLATLEQEKSALDEALSKIAPILDKFALQQQKEVERRRALAARDLRRRSRDKIKISYRIAPNGKIDFRGGIYTVEEFKARVVKELRKDKWIAFYAYASPKTTFGTVVNFRKKLLKNSGEFDTYWDNVTSKDSKFK